MQTALEESFGKQLHWLSHQEHFHVQMVVGKEEWHIIKQQSISQRQGSQQT